MNISFMADRVYDTVLDRNTVEIVIPLGKIFPVTDNNSFTDEELALLERILPKFIDRNFDMKMPGWKFGGCIRDLKIRNHPEHSRPEIIFSVTF